MLEIKDKKMFRAAIILFVLNVVDWAITTIIVTNGWGTEYNPVVLWLANLGWGWKTVLVVKTVVCLRLLTLTFQDGWTTVTRTLMLTITSIYGMVVVWNTGLLSVYIYILYFS